MCNQRDLKALFSTSIIQDTKPYRTGQAPVVRAAFQDDDVRLYSSGKLEIAHARGYEIFVVTAIPSDMLLPRYHGWWRKLVPDDRVFSPASLDGEWTAERLRYALVDPWRRAYAALGIDWTDGIEGPDAARRQLVASGIVTDGMSFYGFAVN